MTMVVGLTVSTISRGQRSEGSGHQDCNLLKCNLGSLYNWRALWKNWICSTTMKLRKSIVKPVMQLKTCNYNELFGSSARDWHAGRI